VNGFGLIRSCRNRYPIHGFIYDVPSGKRIEVEGASALGAAA
jgi:hypothetical protein